jgi:hypothetical protein
MATALNSGFACSSLDTISAKRSWISHGSLGEDTPWAGEAVIGLSHRRPPSVAMAKLVDLFVLSGMDGHNMKFHNKLRKTRKRRTPT